MTPGQRIQLRQAATALRAAARQIDEAIQWLDAATSPGDDISDVTNIGREFSEMLRAAITPKEPHQ